MSLSNTITTKLLNIVDFYNTVKIYDQSQDETEILFIDNIPDFISSENTYKLHYIISKLKVKIVNCLINNVLSNSPETDIIIFKFPNIKTNLFPYQINNLNWMINIENKNYTEEYKEISEKIIFKGGGLFDEVGMGKTLQIITLVNYNKSTNYNLIHKDKIFSKATLIIVPNHLCGQWVREFELHTEKPLNIINLLTKRHYNKYSYYDFIKCDVVIISSNFFINCKLNQHEQVNGLSLVADIFNTDVNIFNIYWHRVVIDEFHEFNELSINSNFGNSNFNLLNLFIRLKFIESNYRWVISGTPFKETGIHNYSEFESTSLSCIVDYLTENVNIVNKIDIINQYDYSYIRNHFSRNTHVEQLKILKLPDISEEVVWLHFSETERMIYNAYLADPNNTPNDVFLRQICCHPMISDKIRDSITSSTTTLTDIQKHIEKMYLSDFNKADEQYNTLKDRIERITAEIQVLEKEKKTNLITYSNLKEDLTDLNKRIVNSKVIRDGKEKTVNYYKKFIEVISSTENIAQQDCGICLDNINKNDIGIVVCGHIYCYSCINSVIINAKKNFHTPKCPTCQKPISSDGLFLINDSTKNNETDEINNLGTKIAWIINYIKQTPKKYRIIFSQWDYLLKEVGKVLEDNGIKNLYCQGNVYQKDKVLKLFNSNDVNSEYKIIMLSSSSTVSGSNLNNAEEIIFLDPVYGNKQERINTEKQAIGRVIRLGNKHKTIKIIRLLINDSVEQDIYNANQISGN